MFLFISRAFRTWSCFPWDTGCCVSPLCSSTTLSSRFWPMPRMSAPNTYTHVKKYLVEKMYTFYPLFLPSLVSSLKTNTPATVWRRQPISLEASMTAHWCSTLSLAGLSWVTVLFALLCFNKMATGDVNADSVSGLCWSAGCFFGRLQCPSTTCIWTPGLHFRPPSGLHHHPRSCLLLCLRNIESLVFPSVRYYLFKVTWWCSGENCQHCVFGLCLPLS